MDITIQAKKRNSGVKNNKLRGEGWTPACVYGHHFESTNIQVKTADMKKCLSQHAAMITVNIEGKGNVLVGVDEVQKNHLGNELVHVSFHALDLKEKADLEVPIEIVGEALGFKSGGILKEQFHEITVRGYPKDLPNKIVVDVSHLDIGDNIHVSDLVKNYKCEFLKEDLDKIIVSCGHPKLQLVPETVVPETEEVATEVAAEATTETATATTTTTEKKAA